jgi:hypothetical protein
MNLPTHFTAASALLFFPMIIERQLMTKKTAEGLHASRSR